MAFRNPKILQHIIFVVSFQFLERKITQFQVINFTENERPSKDRRTHNVYPFLEPHVKQLGTASIVVNNEENQVLNFILVFQLPYCYWVYAGKRIVFANATKTLKWVDLHQ